jgi:hypothetical protein
VAVPPSSTDDRTPVPVSSGAPEVAAGATTADRAPVPRGRRRLDVKLLAASLAIAVGLVLIGFALLRADLGGEDDFPSAIQNVSPVPDAVQVLTQTQVIVDLAEGYEGRLMIDGTELDTVRLDELGNANAEPGTQVDVPPGVVFEPGNGTLTFTPGEGAPIERFADGTHTATVFFWRSEEGPAAARSFTWTFAAV